MFSPWPQVFFFVNTTFLHDQDMTTFPLSKGPPPSDMEAVGRMSRADVMVRDAVNMKDGLDWAAWPQA